MPTSSPLNTTITPITNPNPNQTPQIPLTKKNPKFFQITSRNNSIHRIKMEKSAVDAVGSPGSGQTGKQRAHAQVL
jgi:hypothetical protein